KEAAFKLKTGEYTKKPVKTQFGYHIIKMIKHPSKGSFQSHKSEIIARIYQKMAQDQNVIKSVLGVVLKRANVNIKDNDLKNVLTQYMDADLKK
ncbi:MAG: peptidylprolyl isomerase, partial [Lactobacillus iners]|nr:peptidylprolyl isomerase [Lactobacillus iners]